MPLVSRKNIRSGMGCCSRMWSSSDRSGRKRLEGKFSAALVLVSYLTAPRSAHSALPARTVSRWRARARSSGPGAGRVQPLPSEAG